MLQSRDSKRIGLDWVTKLYWHIIKNNNNSLVSLATKKGDLSRQKTYQQYLLYCSQTEKKNPVEKSMTTFPSISGKIWVWHFTCKKVPYYPCWDGIKEGQVRVRTSIPTGGQWSPSPEVLVEIELLHLLGLNRVPYLLLNGVVSRKPCGDNVFDPVVIRPLPPQCQWQSHGEIQQ